MPTHENELSSTALDALRAELLAIPRRDLLRVNLDVARAALVVIGAAPDIRAYRADLVDLFCEERAAIVDRIELVARAALHAHSTLRSLEAGAEVPALSAEVVSFREVLVAVVRTLVARRLLADTVLRELQGSAGFTNQSLDVLQLTSMLSERWADLGPHTGLDLAYLRRAESAANALATAVGIRNQASRSSTADLRQRAFTLLAREYDEARRLITCLRWHEGDADRIAPSFMGRPRGGRKKKRVSREVAEPTSPEPTTQVVAPSPDVPGADPFPTT